MKKFVSIVLALLMLALPVSAGAVTDLEYEWYVTLSNIPYIDDFETYVAPNDMDPNNPETMWAAFAVNTGVMSVDENGNFRPNECVTRAETAAILDKLPFYDPSDDMGVTWTYNDVQKSAWYYDCISDQGGYISGSTPDGLNMYCHPDANIEKGDFVVGLFRRLCNADPEDYWFDPFWSYDELADFVGKFQDANEIDELAIYSEIPYRFAYNQFIFHGVIKPYNGDDVIELNTHDPITRIEVARMITRVYNKFHYWLYIPGHW